jgi:hypothetical protein
VWCSRSAHFGLSPFCWRRAALQAGPYPPTRLQAGHGLYYQEVEGIRDAQRIINGLHYYAFLCPLIGPAAGTRWSAPRPRCEVGGARCSMIRGFHSRAVDWNGRGDWAASTAARKRWTGSFGLQSTIGILLTSVSIGRFPSSSEKSVHHTYGVMTKNNLKLIRGLTVVVHDSSEVVICTFLSPPIPIADFFPSPFPPPSLSIVLASTLVTLHKQEYII